VIYHFEGHRLDCERRELWRGADLLAVEPQVFDLLRYLIENRARVVSKDDLLVAVWRGRIVSESTLGSRINAVRKALGDTGSRQALIRTIARKGLRFVGDVREQHHQEERPAEAPAATQAMAPPAQRRPVSLMLCVMAEAVAASHPDPEELRDVAAPHFSRVREAVERYGGSFATTSGNEIVACFGYPTAHENDAECAVRAALESVAASAGEPVPLRIGIATGLVIAGDDTGAFIGAAPDLARGLAMRAAEGSVVACPATRRQIGSLFEVSAFDAAGAVRVLQRSAVVDRYAALRPRRWPLIGRDEELALLLRRWQQVQGGSGRMVVICGEPGIGKSRLAAALNEEISAVPHASLAYFGSPHRAASPLYPIIAQIERGAGFEAHDDDITRFARLERWAAELPVPGGVDLAQVAELLEISVPGRVEPHGLSPQRRKEMLFESLAALVAGMAAQRRLLLEVEDAQWLDPTTLDWLDLLVERLSGLPLLMIVTCRPGFHVSWLDRAEVTALTLTRLARPENVALASHITVGADLAPEVLDLIVERSDGVPLFIEELAASVMQSLAVQAGDSATALKSAAVPSTLQALLAARLDRLKEARAVVQSGAALGRQFDYRLLRSVTGLADDELARLLEEAVAAGLLDRRGALPDTNYTFRHALLQDAAYASMLRAQRLTVERRVVLALERDRTDVVERHPEVLAHHCEAADQPEQAIEYRLKAARQALDRSAGVESRRQVERAQSLLPRIAEAVRASYEGRLEVALGNALIMTCGFAAPEVRATLSRARERLDPARYPVESLSALCALSNYHLIRSESPLCLALVEPLATRVQEPPAATVIEYLVGTAHLHLGNFESSARHLEAALTLYDEGTCRPLSLVAGLHLRSFALIWLSLARLYLGFVEAATETIVAAVADARGRSHPFTLVSALLATARFRLHVGDLTGAVAVTEEGMAIAREQRSPYHVSRAAVLRAVNLIEDGKAVDGIAAMQAALVEHRATGANFQSSFNLSCLARGHARAGDVAMALDFADQALAEIERCGERWWEAEALRTKGEILVQASLLDEAAACFEQALTCARRQKAQFWELRAARCLAAQSDCTSRRFFGN
jgi:DNA-binding winged helix-turn-helix (wHTH) protein/tetratricopeptide (TPR) repeat protein